jgi:hypothetical protein
MGEGLARLLINATGLYLGLGVLFALPFAARWAGRLDPAAAAGSWGFRLLIVPGAVLLWPLLLYRVLRAG